jgi:secreted trypsin-like serine protease
VVQPALVTADDPSGHVAGTPGFYDGVVKLISEMSNGDYVGCTGSLLAGGQHLVTAAHCVSDGSAGAGLTVNALYAAFMDGQMLMGASYFVAPGWTGSYLDGHDIAVVKLASQAAGIPGYTLYRDPDPANVVIDVAGYGLTGSGATGAEPSTFGTLHTGQNELEGAYWQMQGSPYAWDFDDGDAAHDALCAKISVCSLGLGSNEASIAFGDSGGPSFYNGYLIGVHSFLGRIDGADIDGLINSTFGELAGDTRVNIHADWIDSITAVPEPGSMLMLGSGLAGLLLAARRRR